MISGIGRKYVPDELNNTFDLTSSRILNTCAMFRSNLDIDAKMIDEQIRIILEKFANKLLKTIITTHSKFVSFIRIKRTLDMDKPLFFFVLQNSIYRKRK